MSRLARARLCHVLAAWFLLVAAALPAAAQEAVFPNDGTVGLVPPSGMSEIPGVPGFEDRVAHAAILIMEVPGTALEDVSKSFTPEALETKGVTVENRRDVTLKSGAKGVLMSGYQTMGAAALKKWIMLVGDGKQGAMVTVQFPEDSAARYSDDAVEAALMSVTFRPPPTQEELLSRLPFTIKDMEGYRVVRVFGTNAALLTKGDAASGDLSRQPFFIVSIAPGEVREDDRESLAKRAISSVPGVKELKIERGGTLRIGGQPGYELIANAVEMRTGTPVKVAQWVRFGRSGYVRMVGVAPAEGFDTSFNEMRGLRDGIELR
ncbi:hypothetical protein [Ancylobacter mangrovi]|uniref:hypothetical protein n=1 Tax=Ancylobacter mangrovi TaxID=2972472 RepID=UPI002163207C|nr:hypothetical protein [Ancylobacter mangrovi]MCS0502502.1 hypothetical protein [Ancylobacter mangrovi]